MNAIHYMTPDGRKLTASLEPTDCNNCGTPFQQTYDPRWVIDGIADHQTWLGYKGGDNNLWWVKVHAQYVGDPAPFPGAEAPGQIAIWLEHRGPEDGRPPDDLPDGTNDFNRIRIGYFGHDGEPLLATISPWVRPRHSPDFPQVQAR
jgi:hypothetical protein